MAGIANEYNDMNKKKLLSTGTLTVVLSLFLMFIIFRGGYFDHFLGLSKLNPQVSPNVLNDPDRQNDTISGNKNSDQELNMILYSSKSGAVIDRRIFDSALSDKNQGARPLSNLELEFIKRVLKIDTLSTDSLNERTSVQKK